MGLACEFGGDTRRAARRTAASGRLGHGHGGMEHRHPRLQHTAVGGGASASVAVLPHEGQMLQVQGVWRAGAATVVTTQGLEVDVSVSCWIVPGRFDGSVVQVQGALNRSVGTLVAAQVQTLTVPRPWKQSCVAPSPHGRARLLWCVLIDGSQATWVGDSATGQSGQWALCGGHRHGARRRGLRHASGVGGLARQSGVGCDGDGAGHRCSHGTLSP